MFIDYQQMLRNFHFKYGHEMHDAPTIPSRETEKLRIRLIQEEATELIGAIDDKNMIEIADGIADLLYVTFGTAVAYGIPIDHVFQEIHANNMTKSTEKNEFGKTIKGPDWHPPNIKLVLELHGWKDSK